MQYFIIFVLLFSRADIYAEVLLDSLKEEIKTEYNILKDNSPSVYYLAYRAEEEETVNMQAVLGALSSDYSTKHRRVVVQLRVGSPELDNTHEIKGRRSYDYSRRQSPEVLPLEDDKQVIKLKLWDITRRELGKAIERYKKVTANETVMAKAEDSSPDYSITPPAEDIILPQEMNIDKTKWKEVLERVSRLFREFPEIYDSGINLSAERQVKYYVDSSGTALSHPAIYLRIYITASTQSEDGMPLFLHESYSGFSLKDLPDEKALSTAVRNLAGKLMKLRTAPIAEPYLGPAIFLNRAAAVFFHEVLGHRLEGHRQKSEKEGQTFTKKINEPVLPAFMGLFDDPSMKFYGEKPLFGYYAYDDEGVRGKKTLLVEKGVLKNFLMSCSPITNFPDSNGHGRASFGRNVVARQANLIVTADTAVSFENIKKLLIEECKKKDKPYGLLFADVSGGFTITRRSSVQAFKVIPLEVYRIYTDSGKEELLRGVEIVGTPLAALEKIICASDDPEVFNGYCGAESGFIPVSAVSPSVLVGEIEVEKAEKDMEKPPVLPSPLTEGAK